MFGDGNRQEHYIFFTMAKKSSLQQSLQEFVTYCRQFIHGDEKAQAQVFLDRFFQAFGHAGALEVGAVYQERIKKGNTGFADLVWRPRVLIEMKKRGQNLSKHYSQAFDYWIRLVPDRPRYVILCNFDEFWIFDFNIQLDTPVDQIALIDLPDRFSAFSFMEFANRTPIFRNNQVEVTEKAACYLGLLFNKIKTRTPSNQLDDNLTILKFVLQCMLVIWSEKTGILPNNLFVNMLDQPDNIVKNQDIFNILSQQLKQLENLLGSWLTVFYPLNLTLTSKELEILQSCAKENWSKIRPAIFGNIFEGAIDPDQRHKHGIHYTSEADIMQIVRPTISQYWEQRIEDATTVQELTKLQLELAHYKVLDPACGSGNFLYIAYQELKRIEKILMEKIEAKSSNSQKQMSLVTPLQFYGMDINPFAVELARVTLSIARKIAIDNFHLNEPILPLDTLDKNIVCTDALFTEWVRADAIIGNPPFLGGKHCRLRLGDEYMERVFTRFSNIKDVDFCTYWFRLTHDNLSDQGRAGLVGTNSISQGKSRAVSLDYLSENGGFIYEAISTKPWSGGAKVHVSIVNWCKEKPQEYYLDHQKVNSINPSLKAEINVASASRLNANLNWCFQGVIPVGKGFIVTENQVKEWINLSPKNQEVLKLFSMGENLANNPHGKPERWIIDFNDLSLEDASNYHLPWEYIKVNVKPEREHNRNKRARIYWWQFSHRAPGMRKAIESLSSYFTVPRVSKWAIFMPAPINWLPGDLNVVIASDDFYILGILSSHIHRLWIKAQSSTLKGDTRYTNTTCFETFPFPQNPSPKIITKIRETMQNLHKYRTEEMEKKQWGITQLYNLSLIHI